MTIAREVLAAHLRETLRYFDVAGDDEYQCADSILSALDKAGSVLVDCSNCLGHGTPEIRPNPGTTIERDRCGDTDEVCGAGFLHVEQMDKNLYWARLDTGIPGKDVVMWFRSKGRITLIAEFD